MTEPSDLFKHLNFLIISDSNNTGNDEFVEETKILLRDHNCNSILTFNVSEDTVSCPADSPDFGQKMEDWFIEKYGGSDIHFIVSKTCDFPFYQTAAFHFLIPVIQPDWISQCILVNRHIRTSLFSPDRRHILNKQQIYVSRQILKTGSPVEYSLYIELINCLGGSFVGVISTKTTHIIATSADDISITKVLESKLDVNIKFVYPSWLIHCFKSCQLVSEDTHKIQTDSHREDADNPQSSSVWATVNNLPFTCIGAKFLEGHTFYISMDVSLPRDQYIFLLDFIKSLGATVYHQVTPTDCIAHRDQYDCFLGYGRNAKEYKLLMTLPLSKRPSIGNLVWLFSMWSLNYFVSLTDRPVKIIYRPFGPKVFSKRDLQPSYTNYFGAQRFYIQRMVDLLGGVSSTQLSKKNTHLISRSPVGKKYLTAVKWGEARCKVINHLWLERCFMEGEALSVDSSPDFKDLEKINGDIRLGLGQMVYEETGEKEVEKDVGTQELPLSGGIDTGVGVEDIRGTGEEKREREGVVEREGISQKDTKEERSDIVTNSTFDNIIPLPQTEAKGGRTNTTLLSSLPAPPLNKESSGMETATNTTAVTTSIKNSSLNGTTLAGTKTESQMSDKKGSPEVKTVYEDKQETNTLDGEDKKEMGVITAEGPDLHMNGEDVKSKVDIKVQSRNTSQGEETAVTTCSSDLKVDVERVTASEITTTTAVRKNADLDEGQIQHGTIEETPQGPIHAQTGCPTQDMDINEERKISEGLVPKASPAPEVDSDKLTIAALERSSDRAAKRKAEKRLFSDIEALNDFEKRNPRRRKVVDLLPEEREEIQERRALENEARQILEKCGYYSNNNKEEGKQVRRHRLHMNCICTGCHFDNMSKLDKLLLQMVGVVLYNEGYEDVERRLNCIIAPKRLRTAKFLSSLSFKPLKYALVPTFFEDLIKKIKESAAVNDGSTFDIENVINVDDYSIPELPRDLLEKTRLPTQIFERAQISAVNLVHEIPGGFHTISKILEDHGISKVNSVKARGLGKFSNIVKNKIDDTDEGNSRGHSRGSSGRRSSTAKSFQRYKPPSYVLIATSSHQATKFRKVCSENDPDANGILVVTWDWCVNSIFNLDVDYDDKEHILYKHLQER